MAERPDLWERLPVELQTRINFELVRELIRVEGPITDEIFREAARTVLRDRLSHEELAPMRAAVFDETLEEINEEWAEKERQRSRAERWVRAVRYSYARFWLHEKVSPVLCRLGVHGWETRWGSDIIGETIVVGRACGYCEREEFSDAEGTQR